MTEFPLSTKEQTFGNFDSSGETLLICCFASLVQELYVLLKISPNLVLQLLLLLFRPPASEPAEDNRPFPEELSLCALGLAHMGLAPAHTETRVISTEQPQKLGSDKTFSYKEIQIFVFCTLDMYE